MELVTVLIVAILGAIGGFGWHLKKQEETHNLFLLGKQGFLGMIAALIFLFLGWFPPVPILYGYAIIVGFSGDVAIDTALEKFSELE